MSDPLVEAELVPLNALEALAPGPLALLLNNPIVDGFERHILEQVNAFAGKTAHEFLSHLSGVVGSVQAKVPEAARPLVGVLLDRLQSAIAPALVTPSTPEEQAPAVTYSLDLSPAQHLALAKKSKAEIAAFLGA